MAKVTVAGHSLHAIINDWPIALFTTSLAFDFLYLATRKEKFAQVGHYNMLAGIGTGLVAAVTGIAEYRSVQREGKVKEYAQIHAALNGALFGLAVLSYAFRRKQDPPFTKAALTASGLVSGLTILSAWYGDEMVYGEAVRVQDQKMREDSIEIRPPGDRKLVELLRNPIP